MVWSVAFGIFGVAPLLLYIVFGSADRNSIGLGLLAVLASAAGVCTGLIKMLNISGIFHKY